MLHQVLQVCFLSFCAIVSLKLLRQFFYLSRKWRLQQIHIKQHHNYYVWLRNCVSAMELVQLVNTPVREFHLHREPNIQAYNYLGLYPF